jgi:membrane protease YdiL (CAAX protease family)
MPLFLEYTGREMNHNNSRPALVTLISFGLAYCAVWIDLFLPIPAIPVFSLDWFMGSSVKNIFRIIATLIILKRWLGIPATVPFGTKILPQAGDIVQSLTVATAVGLVAFAGALIAIARGNQNPLLLRVPELSFSILTLAAIFISCLCVGYAEELFFRFFALKAFAKAGFSLGFATGLSAFLFGISHGSQGLMGMAMAFILALVFSFFRNRGASIHAISIGHALYNLGIIFLASVS